MSGSIVLQLKTGRLGLGTQFVAISPGDPLDLTQVQSLRLVGIYCFEACTVPAIKRLVQEACINGTQNPRDPKHELGTCVVSFEGEFGDNYRTLKPNETRFIEAGTVRLFLVRAKRAVADQDAAPMPNGWGSLPSADYH